jgi:hypothetical protein
MADAIGCCRLHHAFRTEAYAVAGLPEGRRIESGSGASAGLGQDDQHQRYGRRAADAGRDLRERHQLHPVGGGQDRDVAGAAWPL